MDQHEVLVTSFQKGTENKAKQVDKGMAHFLQEAPTLAPSSLTIYSCGRCGNLAFSYRIMKQVVHGVYKWIPHILFFYDLFEHFKKTHLVVS